MAVDVSDSAAVVSYRGRGRRTRAVVLTTVIGIALVLAFALVFSVAQGTRRITTAAEALHSADEALRQATTVRAQLGLAVVMANVDRAFGTNSTEAQATSIEETRLALTQFAEGIDRLDADRDLSDRFQVGVDDFAAASHDVLGVLEAGEVEAARDLANSNLDESFRNLQELLVVERSELNAEVASSDQFLSWIGNLARFLVAFLVPTAVIIVYRELARRQQRQLELEGRLATERELGKAREDFIANASHELRTPLTSIYGLALLLEEDPAFSESATARELLNMIISESADLSRMVEDLLTTARLDAGALHYTFENVEVLDEVDEVAGPMVRAGVDIRIEAPRAVVRVDRLRFRQVLRNLLSNARKYGGPEIRIDGRIEEGRFVLTIADNGDGIPTEIEERLFQRFLHQGHQPLVLGSVGLGLSIVRALAEGMGGAVHYERSDGWTRFVVVIPLVAVPGAVSPSGPAEVGIDLGPDEAVAAGGPSAQEGWAER